MHPCAKSHKKIAPFQKSTKQKKKKLWMNGGYAFQCPNETVLNQQSRDEHSINVTWHRSINKCVTPICDIGRIFCAKLDYSLSVYALKWNSVNHYGDLNTQKIYFQYFRSLSSLCWCFIYYVIEPNYFFLAKRIQMIACVGWAHRWMVN